MRLWDGQILIGYYAAADGNFRSEGTTFFVLHPEGEYAEGRRVGLSYDGPIVTGHAALARTQEEVLSVIASVLDSEKAQRVTGAQGPTRGHHHHARWRLA